MNSDGIPIDVSDIGSWRAFWRWRSATPVQPAPHTVYGYITVGVLTDGRWYAEHQDIGIRAVAHDSASDALECARRWMATEDWQCQFHPQDQRLPPDLPQRPAG